MASMTVMMEDMKSELGKRMWILEKFGISSDTIYRWLDKLKTYAEMRKAYTFVTRPLLKELLHFERNVWTLYPEATWDLMLTCSGNDPVVLKYKDCKTDTLTVWKRRPKGKRRGSE